MKLKVFFAGVALAAGSVVAVNAQQDILNASYSLGREVYANVNEAFVPYWKAKTGENVSVRQSHAGSSRQARAILEGLQADVVTFNQATDIQLLAEGGFVNRNWASDFAHSASPFYSVHSILVREGNPKQIQDWDDLAKPGVQIVQVNPKAGGNGRYAVLAYYAYGLEKYDGDEAKALDFLKRVLANVVVFEQGGAIATSTFTERNIGDVLVTFEAETLFMANAEDAPFESITPSVSILSEFPVALVERVAERRGSTELARGYLEFLYTEEGQTAVAESFHRPRNEEVAERFSEVLKPVKTLEATELFGDWDQITTTFFANNALVDQLLREIAMDKRRR